ncbi:MAG: hypothetical protein AAGJ35_13570, partial [Myxococcota bacterium]
LILLTPTRLVQCPPQHQISFCLRLALHLHHSDAQGHSISTSMGGFPPCCPCLKNTYAVFVSKTPYVVLASKKGIHSMEEHPQSHLSPETNQGPPPLIRDDANTDAKAHRTLQQRLAVYTIIQHEKSPKKSHWLRIGVAFVNRDQSLNVVLNALPTNNTLHIRNEPEF